MYCYQCEQTGKGAGCTLMGVCGKDPVAAALQDLLVYAAKGISMYAHRAAQLNAVNRNVDRAILEALFATVTNVDFDPQRLVRHLLDAAEARSTAKAIYEAACAKAGKTPETLGGPAAWQPRRRSGWFGPPGGGFGTHQASGAVGQRHGRPARVDPLRTQRRSGLCRSCHGAGFRRSPHLRHVP